MTDQYIAFHAAERPDAVAIVDDGRAFTYGRLNRDINAAADALCELGLKRGAWAAVGCADVYFHWVLLLALGRLGVASLSLHNPQTPIGKKLFARMALVLSEESFPAEIAPRHHSITPEWIASVLACSAHPKRSAAPQEPDDPVRIFSTSGTTGASKTVVLSRRIFDRWVDLWIWRCGLSQACRYLMTMPFTVEGAYQHATACLRAGGTLISDHRTRNVGQALSSHGVTQVTMLPIHLRQVLDELPAGFVKPADLTVSTLGAAVPQALRERTVARLAIRLYETYGCNEVGFICSKGRDGDSAPGTVFPGVQVEVVDEHDRPVPNGAVGRIRVRSTSMVAGYLGEPEATRRMFRGGWFYPGDLGILERPGRLQTISREDDLLNIGGGKISPERLEELVAKAVTVADVGACSIRNANGVDELGIAVTGWSGDDSALLERVTAALAYLQLGKFYVIKLGRIPRTPTGKIQRNLLRDAIAVAARRPGGKPVEGH